MKKAKLACFVLVGLLSANICCACGSAKVEEREISKQSVGEIITNNGESDDKDKKEKETDRKEIEDIRIEDGQAVQKDENDTADKANKTEEEIEETITEEKITEPDRNETTSVQKEEPKKETTGAGQGTTTEANKNSGVQNSSSELHTRINKILSQIITPTMTELEKAIVIHDYITYHIDYDYDNYCAGTIPDTSYSPLGALQTGWAVCQGYALLFNELALAADLEAIYVEGVVNETGIEQPHGWNQVKIDGKWYNVDVTWDDPTFTGKEHQDNTQSNYWLFLISDASLRKANHVWDSTTTNSCSADIGKKDFFRALENVNKQDNVFFAETEAQVEAAVITMAAKEKESFVIYMLDSGEYMQNMQMINMVCAKNATTYVCKSGYEQSINRFDLTKDKELYAMKEFSEIGNILRNYKGSYDNLKIRCYNEAFSNYGLTDYNLGTIIAYELACAGIPAEMSGYSEITDNHTTITLKTIDSKAIVIDDLADLISLGNENVNVTVWYSGGSIKSENMYEEMYKATIPGGKAIDIATGRRDDYYGITSFSFNGSKSIMYAENMDEVRAYGIDRIVSDTLYIPMNETLKAQIFAYVEEELDEISPPYGVHDECGFYVFNYFGE